MNLSGRLQRIREFNRPARAEKQACGQQPREEQTPVRKIGGAKTLPAPLADSSFKEEGYFTLRRKLAVNLPVPLRARFPKTLAALAPALADAGLTADDLIFFDLETTGLSGGAGTVAFLAAFGRFSGGNYGAIDVDQYLLLDHAGEEDFLRLIEPHFSPLAQDRPAVIVSYNGKSFDSQVIRSRFLFNGMPSPPIDRHADLLYAARCLWKRKLPSCSQSEIERSVLGIDRGDDIPGSRAPDIWFSFLKTNDAAELAGVCRHNLLDIAGLASILGALCDIACDPERYGEKYGADFETLARRIRRHRRSYNGSDTAPPEMEIAERAALEAAVRLGSPLAMFLLGKDLLRDRQYGAAFGLLGGLAERTDTALAAVAARALAVDSEWRLLDTSRALRYAEKSLFLAGDEGPLKEDALRRIDRLLRKRERGGLQPALIQ